MKTIGDLQVAACQLRKIRRELARLTRRSSKTIHTIYRPLWGMAEDLSETLHNDFQELNPTSIASYAN